MSVRRKVRILSGGLPHGTHVFIDGVDVSAEVAAVVWTHAAGQTPSVAVRFVPDAVELEGDLEEEGDG